MNQSRKDCYHEKCKSSVSHVLTFTDWVSLSVWKRIGLEPKRRLEFILADGTPIKRGVSECYLVLLEGEGHTPVILGEESDQALLGVVTLEILGLVFNPFSRTLHPMKMLLV